METRKAVMHVGVICLRVAVFVMVVLGIVYLGQTTYRYTRAVFSDEAFEEAPGVSMKVTVPEEVSSKYLAEILEEKGIIENASVFKIQMKMQNFGDAVKEGTYQLNTSMKPSEILSILSGAAGEGTP